MYHQGAVGGCMNVELDAVGAEGRGPAERGGRILVLVAGRAPVSDNERRGPEHGPNIAVRARRPRRSFGLTEAPSRRRIGSMGANPGADPASDRSLVEAYRAGDEPAAGTLVERH